MKPKKEHTEQDYLSFNPFEGDFDDGARCQSSKIVKTRKVHQCILEHGEVDHVIPVGSLARFDKAVIDDEWVTSYCCIECMDKEIA